jgi:hypothetical protein
MTDVLMPALLAEPPPYAPVWSANEDMLDLMDDDVRVGWRTPTAIGFTGFANEVEAAGAAWVAHRTLQRRLARFSGARPIPIDTERLAIADREGARVVIAAGREVARIVAPFDDERQTESWTGFELHLDSPLDELTMRAATLLVYRTLRRSGIRWSMWMRSLTGGD